MFSFISHLSFDFDLLTMVASSFSSPIPFFPRYVELYGQSQTFFISVMKEISYVSFYFYGFVLYISL